MNSIARIFQVEAAFPASGLWPCRLDPAPDMIRLVLKPFRLNNVEKLSAFNGFQADLVTS